MPSFFRMLLCGHLPLQRRLAHQTPQLEVLHVRELPRPPRLVGQLRCLAHDHLVLAREHRLHPVAALQLQVERVEMNTVVDDKHACHVVLILAEPVDTACADVGHTDLFLVVLGEDHEFDTAAPGRRVADPVAVGAVWLAQDGVAECDRVVLDCPGDELSHGLLTVQVDRAVLHDEVNTREQARVVRRHNLALHGSCP